MFKSVTIIFLSQEVHSTVWSQRLTWPSLLRWNLWTVLSVQSSWNGSILKAAVRLRSISPRVDAGAPLPGKVITGCALTQRRMVISLPLIMVFITECRRLEEREKELSLQQVTYLFAVSYLQKKWIARFLF